MLFLASFRLISLTEPEMFVVESGIRIHTAASEAFAAIPGYYIQQVVIRDAQACGYPVKKKKSFIVGDYWYDVETAEDDLDLTFLTAFAIARTEQTFYD